MVPAIKSTTQLANWVGTDKKKVLQQCSIVSLGCIFIAAKQAQIQHILDVERT